MPEQYSHLVFYDGECGLCDRVVQLLIKFDRQEQFAFAPLKGSTAALYLQDLPEDLKNIDSLILIENYAINPKIYTQSGAVFRIFWLLGGVGLLIGWLSFLPSVLFDWFYRWIARNRYRFFKNNSCFVPPKDQDGRFLP